MYNINTEKINIQKLEEFQDKFYHFIPNYKIIREDLDFKVLSGLNQILYDFLEVRSFDSYNFNFENQISKIYKLMFLIMELYNICFETNHSEEDGIKNVFNNSESIAEFLRIKKIIDTHKIYPEELANKSIKYRYIEQISCGESHWKEDIIESRFTGDNIVFKYNFGFYQFNYYDFMVPVYMILNSTLNDIYIEMSKRWKEKCEEYKRIPLKIDKTNWQTYLDSLADELEKRLPDGRNYFYKRDFEKIFNKKLHDLSGLNFFKRKKAERDNRCIKNEKEVYMMELERLEKDIQNMKFDYKNGYGNYTTIIEMYPNFKVPYKKVRYLSDGTAIIYEN